MTMDLYMEQLALTMDAWLWPLWAPSWVQALLGRHWSPIYTTEPNPKKKNRENLLKNECHQTSWASMVFLFQSFYLVKSITLQKALVTDLLVPPGLVLAFFSLGSHYCSRNFLLLLLLGVLVSVYFSSSLTVNLRWKEESAEVYIYNMGPGGGGGSGPVRASGFGWTALANPVRGWWRPDKAWARLGWGPLVGMNWSGLCQLIARTFVVDSQSWWLILLLCHYG